MRRLLLLAPVLCQFLIGGSSVQGTAFEHERLRVRNTFRSPEEVVSYYCARDASGFVWSGLLDAERLAFTRWRDAPQVDSFYIASSYQVHPLKGAKDPNAASVEVTYVLSGIGDAHGTRTPPQQTDYKVVFGLEKIGGLWKISHPDASQIAPVVLESKFPYAGAAD